MSSVPESNKSNAGQKVDFDVSGLAGVVRLDDEGLFARDVEGQLIRVDKATADELDEDVTLTIDGKTVTIKRAVPTRDSQGKLIRDEDGAPIPRPATIYDATSAAFVHKPGDPHPIPTICHKEHLPPIGVCRVCVVEASEKTNRGERTMLVPSCIQRVTDGMTVHTINSNASPDAAARVKAASQTIVELLMADHLPESQSDAAGNELAAVARQLGVGKSRFTSKSIDRGSDSSHQRIAVDHNQCVMCGRCQRGCNWVKHNYVIGRADKGYASRIAFDLDDPMGSSSCVSCGECAISCPTGALEFTPTFINEQIERVRRDMQEEGRNGEIVTADELMHYPLFSGIPYKFLQFNGASVIRRALEKGDVLCREGEHGSTAFIIVKGEFEIFLNTTRGKVQSKTSGGLFGLLFGLKTVSEKGGGRSAKLVDVGAANLQENERLLRDERDLILGEMACMNHYPRSATVVATRSAEVLEIKRNVLYMLQRNAVSREILERAYRDRALEGQLKSQPIFSSLTDQEKEQAAEFLRDKVDLVWVDPGQTIVRQNDPADDYFIIKLGSVKVSRRYGRGERVLDYLRPGTGFGEIGLLSSIGDWLEETLGDSGLYSGVRTATCTALDHVELIRIHGGPFRQLLAQLPTLKEELIKKAKDTLEQNQEEMERLTKTDLGSFLDQGLYQARSLLVLDLERCTRCDECTKACADTHDGVTRLIRDGLRFDKYLVASSCRSCLDPYCLVGCPVDAIHRNGNTSEIEIEDYCIGCGLCADNCPYGNINMHGFPTQQLDPVTNRQMPIVQQRATTCDLCTKIDSKPSCVYACPHDAAERMSGKKLAELTQLDPLSGNRDSGR